MATVPLLATTAGVVAGFMVALWLLSLMLRDASIVDIFWGLGFLASPIWVAHWVQSLDRAWTFSGCWVARFLVSVRSVLRL